MLITTASHSTASEVMTLRHYKNEYDISAIHQVTQKRQTTKSPNNLISIKHKQKHSKTRQSHITRINSICIWLSWFSRHYFYYNAVFNALCVGRLNDEIAGAIRENYRHVHDNISMQIRLMRGDVISLYIGQYSIGQSLNHSVSEER